MTGRPFHYRTCEVIEKCVDQIVLVNVRTFHSYIYFIWGGVKILMGWQFRQKRQQSVVLSGKLQKNKNDRWYLMMCKATVGKFFFALSWNTKRKTIFNIRLRAVIFWGFMACFDLSLQENKTEWWLILWMNFLCVGWRINLSQGAFHSQHFIVGTKPIKYLLKYNKT